jgi:hypothetical protein
MHESFSVPRNLKLITPNILVGGQAEPPSTDEISLIYRQAVYADLKDFYKWLGDSRALRCCSMDEGEDFQIKPRSDSLVETEDQKAEISWSDQEPEISDHNQEADKVTQSDQEAESSNSDNQSDQDETQSLNSHSSSDRVAETSDNDQLSTSFYPSPLDSSSFSELSSSEESSESDHEFADSNRSIRVLRAVSSSMVKPYSDNVSRS